MKLELIKRWRVSAGIETLYKTNVPLGEDYETIKKMAVEIIRDKLRIDRGKYVATNEQITLLADMSKGVYIVSILEEQQDQVRALPLYII